MPFLGRPYVTITEKVFLSRLWKQIKAQNVFKYHDFPILSQSIQHKYSWSSPSSPWSQMKFKNSIFTVGNKQIAGLGLVCKALWNASLGSASYRTTNTPSTRFTLLSPHSSSFSVQGWPFPGAQYGLACLPPSSPSHSSSALLGALHTLPTKCVMACGAE